MFRKYTHLQFLKLGSIQCCLKNTVCYFIEFAHQAEGPEREASAIFKALRGFGVRTASVLSVSALFLGAESWLHGPDHSS